MSSSGNQSSRIQEVSDSSFGGVGHTSSKTISQLRPRKQAAEPQEQSRHDKYPPPVYHRHYKQSTANRRERPPCNGGVIVLFLPILLFGSIIMLVFLQPEPNRRRSPFLSQGATMQMLEKSRLRSKQQEADAHQNPPPTFTAVRDSLPPKKISESYKPNSGEGEDKESNQSENSLDADESSPAKKSSPQNELKKIEMLESKKERILLSSPENVVIELNGAVDEGNENILTLHLQQKAGNSKDGSNTIISREYPIVRDNSSLQVRTASCHLPPPSLFLPIDNFPREDPFLPWIHDYWYVPPSGAENARVHFVAQNKRRCETGKGKEEVMKHWEPQMALFQSIPIDIGEANGERTLRLADSVDTAVIPETRFACHFHEHDGKTSFVTFSRFSFNYEYVLWRKRGEQYSGMFVEQGKDTEGFELSQLLFHCPVPPNITTSDIISNQWFLDLVPIRTRARRGGSELLLTQNHVGPSEFGRFASSSSWKLEYVLEDNVSVSHFVRSSGRWANLPLCFIGFERPVSKLALSDSEKTEKNSPSAAALNNQKKPNNLVACTWTATNYFRRGDATSINDSERRLREWITFHQLVGVDHVYVYDNTQPGNETSSLPLKTLVERYFSPDFVTYVPWPCQVCSNNRPNHPNPGERSSQYAAEASCRERYGPSTEWMAFIDQDEYLIPMMPTKGNGSERILSWKPILEQKRKEGFHVLKMRSSRGKPRLSLMETIVNDTENVCRATGKSIFPKELCVQPHASQTYLRVYNCEYIRPPKPERFQRAMKQIYRPEWVKSHYVHYSTITKPMTEYYEKHVQQQTGVNAKHANHYMREIQSWEWGDVFLDELFEGCLVHAKSIMPHETMYRSSQCQNASKRVCPLGYECPDSTKFVDELHTKNIFQTENGNYCNCWVNHHLEDTLIPQLEAALGLPGSK